MKTLFLDMGIIIGYASYIKNLPKEIEQKELDVFAIDSIKFVTKYKNDYLITCYHIVKDINNFNKRKRRDIDY